MVSVGRRALFVTSTTTDFREVRLKLFVSWSVKV